MKRAVIAVALLAVLCAAGTANAAKSWTKGVDGAGQAKATRVQVPTQTTGSTGTRCPSNKKIIAVWSVTGVGRTPDSFTVKVDGVAVGTNATSPFQAGSASATGSHTVTVTSLLGANWTQVSLGVSVAC